jgi:2,3-dihydroxybiphenyl 1,2-dioxygenase
MAKVQSVVYGHFEVKSLASWREFMALMYGLELKPSTKTGEWEGVVDDAGSRLIFSEGPADDLVANGWLCDDLDGLKERIEAAGGKTEWASDDEAKERGAGRLLRTVDPEGLRIEIVDRTASHSAYEPPRHGCTYKTGALGVGHFTFQTADLDRFERYYVDALGLDVTDYNDLLLMAGVRVRVGFYRANPRHHSVGCASLGVPTQQRMNHFFLELPDHESVWCAFERIQEAGFSIAHEIGVHPNDNLFTFYVISPSGFQAEIGAEGRLVETPEPVVTHRGMARWGHRMPAAQKLRMLPLVARAAVGQLRDRFSG